MIERTSAALILGGFLVGAASPAGAGNWRATSQRDLQEVIDSAVYGDTVYVAPGEYKMLLMRPGIRIIAEEGPEETILKSPVNWCVKATEIDSLSSLEGFTLDGNRGADGVVLAKKAKIEIRNCVLTNGWSGVRATFCEIIVENCKINHCQNGIYMYESEGKIRGNEIHRCIKGLNLVSSGPLVQRNDIARCTIGISVSEHSDPTIGGSLASANRIHDNGAGCLENEALAKNFGIRTMKPMTLRVPYNYWGSDCPDSVCFRGPVEWAPWVDETGTRSLERCPPSSSE
jgi:parallel beta-helix repeat protein